MNCFLIKARLWSHFNLAFAQYSSRKVMFKGKERRINTNNWSAKEETQKVVKWFLSSIKPTNNKTNKSTNIYRLPAIRIDEQTDCGTRLQVKCNRKRKESKSKHKRKRTDAVIGVFADLRIPHCKRLLRLVLREKPEQEGHHRLFDERWSVNYKQIEMTNDQSGQVNGSNRTSSRKQNEEECVQFASQLVSNKRTDQCTTGVW